MKFSNLDIFGHMFRHNTKNLEPGPDFLIIHTHTPKSNNQSPKNQSPNTQITKSQSNPILKSISSSAATGCRASNPQTLQASSSHHPPQYHLFLVAHSLALAHSFALSPMPLSQPIATFMQPTLLPSQPPSPLPLSQLSSLCHHSQSASATRY